ncbi:MAG: YqzL family protein [Oscillospiraceae bacterium]|nr:YqzL family protein [Oscillospiraceae bacterium]
MEVALLDDQNYWKVFESTGNIEYYLRYKTSVDPQPTAAEIKEQNAYANNNNRAGSAGD